MSRYLRKVGCPIIVPAKQMGIGQKAHRCNAPLAPDAKFCAKHEADRIRLMVVQPYRGQVYSTPDWLTAQQRGVR